MNTPFQFPIGASVRDKVTGFEGTITGRADYISGCNCYMVQPAGTKKTELPESKWFDEPRLESAGRKVLSIDDRSRKTGADGQAPSR